MSNKGLQIDTSSPLDQKWKKYQVIIEGLGLCVCRADYLRYIPGGFEEKFVPSEDPKHGDKKQQYARYMANRLFICRKCKNTIVYGRYQEAMNIIIKLDQPHEKVQEPSAAGDQGAKA